MAKFHITPRGVASLCRAKSDNCPYGAANEHYAHKEEAQAAYEAKNSTATFAVKRKAQVKAAFHGSGNIFDEFSYSTLGRSGSDHGWGFYFTDNKELIKSYAGEQGFIYDIDFHPSKPISYKKLTLTTQDFTHFVEMADKKTDGEFLENWGDVQYEGRDVVLKRAVSGLFYKGQGANDLDNIDSLINTEESISKEVYSYLYEQYGYDSIPVREGRGWTEGEIYVATVPEAFSIRGISKARDPLENTLRSGSGCKEHEWAPTLEKIKDTKFSYRKCGKCEQIEKVLLVI